MSARPHARIPWLALALCLGGWAALAHGASLGPRDPLPALLHLASGFLHREESEGVTRDPRAFGYPPEEIRLTVVPQLLAYCELYRVFPTSTHFADIADRADFLARNLDSITSHTASDGLLGYALLSAYEITRDPRHLAPAQAIVRRSLELREFGLRLNWGLMAALALAKHHRLTGDAASLAKAGAIVHEVGRSQNRDGSFPHFCEGSRDVHYTAWMATELTLLRRLIEHPLLDPLLARAHRFLSGRVGLDGAVRYQETLPSGLPLYYYSRESGCPHDYDTRGWVNELGYHALLFDRFADPRYRAVTGRLFDLQERGAFPDKWDFMPAPDDPIYVWASERRSIMRTSLVFWSLATVYADRERMGPGRHLSPSQAVALSPAGAAMDPDRLADPDRPSLTEALAGRFPFSPTGVFLGEAVWDRAAAEPPAGGRPSSLRATGEDREAPPATRPGWLRSLPAPEGVLLSFELHDRGPVSLEIFDLAGRRIRELWRGASGPGEHRVSWDGRDEVGRRVPSGIYLARLRTPSGARAARVALVR